MTNRPLIIDSFTTRPGLLEVVGYGKTRKPSTDATEVEIEAYLARPNPANRYMFDGTQRPVSCWIGCGQLPIVRIGSRWKSGGLAAHRISPKKTEVIRFRRNETLGNVARHDDIEFFPLHGQEQAPFYLVTLGNKAEHRVAFIPVIEMINALFGASSGLLLPFFDGVRNSAVARDRFLIDRAKSGRKDKGQVRLSCSRKPTRQEALISALILTNESVRRAHDQVFQNFSVTSSRQGSAFTEMPFPFSEAIQCTFEYRWISIESCPKRMLITRIQSLEFPWGFESVEVIYPGGGHIENLPCREGHLQATRSDTFRLQTQRAPGTNRVPIDMTVPGTSFATANGVEIIYAPLLLGEQPEQHDLRQDGQSEEIAASTADRRSGGDPGVVHVSIKRRQGDSEGANPSVLETLRASLRETYKAIIWLVRQNNWGIGGQGNSPPLVPVRGDGWQADLLLMILVTDYGSVAIADMGSIVGDPRSLGVITSKSSKSIDHVAASEIVSLAGREGGRWIHRGDKLEGFKIKAIRRPSDAWHDTKYYGGLIERGIISLFSDLAA